MADAPRVTPQEAVITRGALGLLCLRLGNAAILLLWGLLVVNPTTDALGQARSFDFYRRLSAATGLDMELWLGIVALLLAILPPLAAWRGWSRLRDHGLFAGACFWGLLLLGAALSYTSAVVLALAFYLIFVWFALAGWALSSDRVGLL
jgi:hypothetical protein